MSELERQILQDVFVVATVAIAIAALVFGVIRQTNTTLGWNSHGNVWTSPFGAAEVLISGLCFISAG